MGVGVLVVAVVVVGGGLIWGGRALKERGSHGLGLVLLLVGGAVILAGGTRAAVVATRRAVAEIGTGGSAAPYEPTAPASGEGPVTGICQRGAPFEDGYSKAGFCGCVTRAFGVARGEDAGFAVVSPDHGQIEIHGEPSAVDAFEHSFATCAAPALPAWISRECARSCEGEARSQCASLCGCVAREIGRAGAEHFAREAWHPVDGQRGEGPVGRMIDDAIGVCRGG